MLDLIIKHVIKYLFALKAAADGWIVRYLGGNVFEFEKSILCKTNKELPSCDDFIKEYFPNGLKI